MLKLVEFRDLDQKELDKNLKSKASSCFGQTIIIPINKHANLGTVKNHIKATQGMLLSLLTKDGFISQQRLHGTLIATIIDAKDMTEFKKQSSERVKLANIYSFLQKQLEANNIEAIMDKCIIDSQGNIAIVFKTVTDIKTSESEKINIFKFFKQSLQGEKYGALRKYNDEEFLPKFVVVLGNVISKELFDARSQQARKLLSDLAKNLDGIKLSIRQFYICNYSKRTLEKSVSVTKKIVASRSLSPTLEEMQLGKHL